MTMDSRQASRRDPRWDSAAITSPGASGVIGVLLDPGDAERAAACSTDYFAAYSLEILTHAGLPHHPLTRAELLSGALPKLLLIPHPLRLRAEETAALTRHALSGGAIIACGVEGADTLFGVRARRQCLSAARAPARLEWPHGAFGLKKRTLPVWSARLTRPLEEGARPLGALLASDGATLGLAAAIHPVGAGVAVYLAADLPGAVVRIQQGWPVLGDGAPAPDGSAPINDNILKCDDGAALGWDWRQDIAGQRAYLEPHADQLREVLLGAILEAAERVQEPICIRWYWPNGASAVAHLSHDTDSNQGKDGWEFLNFLDSLDVKGTWCVMYPGGYPRELYDALSARGHEIALHYDALTSDLSGARHCEWSEADFQHQLRWLQQESGQSRITNQKNHVTRWEGWVELYRWLEQAGISVDSTKGGSKIGNLGFLFGSAHPWRPMDDAARQHRLMNVLEIPFLSMDMWQTPQRQAVRRALLDRVIEHHGVAHFLFHPQRIWEDGMREAITDIVTYARERQLQWWTSEQIASWEWARRAARVTCHARPGAWLITLDSVPAGLSLLLNLPDVTLEGAPRGVSLTHAEYLGRPLLRVDLGDTPPNQLTLRRKA